MATFEPALAQDPESPSQSEAGPKAFSRLVAKAGALLRSLSWGAARERLAQDELAAKAAHQIQAASYAETAESARTFITQAMATYGEPAFARALSARAWRQSAVSKEDPHGLALPAQTLITLNDLESARALSRLVPPQRWADRVSASQSSFWISRKRSLGIKDFNGNVSAIGAALVLCMQHSKDRGTGRWDARFDIFAPLIPAPSRDDMLACRLLLSHDPQALAKLEAWRERLDLGANLPPPAAPTQRVRSL